MPKAAHAPGCFMNAGYSGTPLARKLGILPGCSVLCIDAAVDYRGLLEPMPTGVSFTNRAGAGVDLALPIGYVDVKVCAVSELWSGLKLVVRKELRC